MFREDKTIAQPDAYASPTPSLNPAFKLAATHGVLASIRLHIDRKDFLDGRDSYGQTALMIASKKNHAEVCRLLIDAGADRTLVDSNGLTAQDLAAAAGAQNSLRVLVESVYKEQLQAGIQPVELPELNAVLPKNLQPSHPATTDLSELDAGSWTPVDERPPPKDLPELRNLALTTQAKISTHQPTDSGVIQWDDVYGYLPVGIEISGLPDQLDKVLRDMVLRGVREGSVPRALLEELLTEIDSSTPERLSHLLVQMLNDLGVEVDERLEIAGVFEDFRPSVQLPASDDEVETQDEALQYLQNLLQGRNEPNRLFTREAYGHPLLTQEEETRTAQDMEHSVEAAIQCLSEWPTGLRILLSHCEDVCLGKRSLRATQNARALEGKEPAEASAEADPADLMVPHLQPHARSDEDTASEREESAGQLNEFIQLASTLRQLVDTSTGNISASRTEVSKLLTDMRLAGSFLSALAEPADSTAPARAFESHIGRYLTARNRFVLSNLKLVAQIARKYLGSGVDFMDLLQEGHIGLIRAVDKFDWRRGFRFSTMATWWIRQQMQRHAPELSMQIRLPAHAVEKSWLMKRHMQEFEIEHGHSPAIPWLAGMVGMPVHKTEAILRCISEPLAIEDLDSFRWLPEPDGTNPVEMTSVKEAVYIAESVLRDAGNKSLRRMAEKVLRMRYGIGTRDELTLDEIGQLFGLTRERIRQIESKGLKLARVHLGLRPPTRDRGYDQDELESCDSKDTSPRTHGPNEKRAFPKSQYRSQESMPA